MTSVRNIDAKSNLEQFIEKTVCMPALSSNISLTESKLIIALKKKLVDAKKLMEQERKIKLRLIEGARDLKRQLVEALKSKVQRSMRFESGNQVLSRNPEVGGPDEDTDQSIESPTINVRMKISSATQTDPQPQLLTSEIDSSSSGRSVLKLCGSPVRTKNEAHAQTEQDYVSHKDHLETEFEI